MFNNWKRYIYILLVSAVMASLFSYLYAYSIPMPMEAMAIGETIGVEDHNNEWFSYLLMVYPEVLLLIGMCILLAIISRFHKYSQNVIFGKYVVFIATSYLFVELKGLFMLLGNGIDTTFFNDQFIINDFVIFAKILIIIGAIFYFATLYDNIDRESYLNVELSLIIYLSIMGMFILISVNDLLMLYLGLELQGLALFVLCGIKKYSNLSIEASLKYFILGSVASAILLLGISLVYGFYGTVNYNNLVACVHSAPMGTIEIGGLFGLGCILVGLLFKLGIVPFHMWMADVFEGSPANVTYFIAVVPKISVLFAFYRLFVVTLPDVLTIFSPFLIFCSILSIVVGSVLALYQIKIKRFLAYSAIVHMGYIVLSLSLPAGAPVAFYYLIIYLLSSVNIFTMYIVIARQNNAPLVNITDIGPVLNSNFMLAFFFTVALLSLAGVPPLPGFFGKLYVFYLLIETGNYMLALALVLLSILSCVYYLRFIRFVLFTEVPGLRRIIFLKGIPRLQAFLISFLFMINVCFIFAQAPILLFLTNIILI